MLLFSKFNFQGWIPILELEILLINPSLLICLILKIFVGIFYLFLFNAVLSQRFFYKFSKSSFTDFITFERLGVIDWYDLDFIINIFN